MSIENVVIIGAGPAGYTAGIYVPATPVPATTKIRQ